MLIHQFQLNIYFTHHSTPTHSIKIYILLQEATLLDIQTESSPSRHAFNEWMHKCITRARALIPPHAGGSQWRYVWGTQLVSEPRRACTDFWGRRGAFSARARAPTHSPHTGSRMPSGGMRESAWGLVKGGPLPRIARSYSVVASGAHGVRECVRRRIRRTWVAVHPQTARGRSGGG